MPLPRLRRIGAPIRWIGRMIRRLPRNRPREARANPRTRLTQNTIIPKPIISPERIARFWKEYDEGKRRSVTRNMSKEEWKTYKSKYNRRKRMSPWFMQNGLWKREPVAVTPSILGTVRTFTNLKGQPHRELVSLFREKIRRSNEVLNYLGTKFEFQPTHILAGRERPNGDIQLLEQAFRGPTLANLMESRHTGNLYSRALRSRLRRKKVKMKEFMHALRLAEAEILTLNRYNQFHDDLHQANILVLDYNPQTKKPLLAVIDHGGSAYTH